MASAVRKPYPTDVSDEEWAFVAPYLTLILVERLALWQTCARAAAIDSMVLRAKGGVWHKKDRVAGVVPHTSIDTEAGWTKSGWHGWVYGWKLHVVCTVGGVWLPLAADLTAAPEADNVCAPALIRELPLELRFLLGDPDLDALCARRNWMIYVHASFSSSALPPRCRRRTAGCRAGR